MGRRESAIRGCLLGLAVGDAMGAPVDRMNWDQICETYGPDGLLGYDTANDNADITSYTQLAAFGCNGLLLATSREKYDKLPRYLAMSQREWAKSQQFRGAGEKTFCWLAQVPCMRIRRCMDSKLLEALGRDALGTPEKPMLRSETPAALTAAISAAVLYNPEKMSREDLAKLGAYSVAFTNGDPLAWRSGAVLACALGSLLQEPEMSLIDCFTEAAETVKQVYPGKESENVQALLQLAITYAGDETLTPLAALSMLGCTTADRCLAGAVYACVYSAEDLDTALIAAVNHAGSSCAVAAVTGAIMGAKLGAEPLPDFYLESLSQVEVLNELARDIAQGAAAYGIFDTEWDKKYNQGLPVNTN